MCICTVTSQNKPLRMGYLQCYSLSLLTLVSYLQSDSSCYYVSFCILLFTLAILCSSCALLMLKFAFKLLKFGWFGYLFVCLFVIFGLCLIGCSKATTWKITQRINIINQKWAANNLWMNAVWHNFDSFFQYFP